MAIVHLKTLIPFLENIGAAPIWRLSQNFLVEANILDKIGRTASIQENSLVIDIGPGPGAFTEWLLEKKMRVVAVELDKKFAEALERFKCSALEVFHEDFLKFPLEKALKERLKEGEKGHVIANIPYHITTPILERLLPQEELIGSITLIVQKEMADRARALAGEEAYGSFSIFLQFYAEIKEVFTVSRENFYPKPKVDSAVIHLKLKKPDPRIDSEKFFQMTRRGFNQRRKMLKVSLKELYAQDLIEKSLSALGLDPKARPEELSLTHFIDFFLLLTADKDRNK